MPQVRHRHSRHMDLTRRGKDLRDPGKVRYTLVWSAKQGRKQEIEEVSGMRFRMFRRDIPHRLGEVRPLTGE